MEKQDQERAVKGSMVLPAVKVIKTMKDKPWDQYLSDEAKDLVSQRILPSVWYPSEPMIDLMEAIYKVVAQGKSELAIQWGKLNFQQLTNSIYKNIIVPGDAYRP